MSDWGSWCDDGEVFINVLLVCKYISPLFSLNLGRYFELYNLQDVLMIKAYYVSKDQGVLDVSCHDPLKIIDFVNNISVHSFKQFDFPHTSTSVYSALFNLLFFILVLYIPSLRCYSYVCPYFLLLW